MQKQKLKGKKKNVDDKPKEKILPRPVLERLFYHWSIFDYEQRQEMINSAMALEQKRKPHEYIR